MQRLATEGNSITTQRNPVTKIEQVTALTSKVQLDSSGAMDRRIPRKSEIGKALLLTGMVLALIIGGYIFVGDAFTGRSLQVAANKLNISTASSGTFEDFIPVRARVAPLKTVYLDAVQGGRVEKILVEDGASVKAGEALLTLSNSDLQLSVMSTESRVMEQLNAMRDLELRLSQNRLNHKTTLVELNYNIRRLTRETTRTKQLIAKASISQSEYDDFADELKYNREKREVTLESQASDEKLMAAQLAFFKDKTLSMEENLGFARKSLQDLTVRAPVAGRLSGFDTEIG